MGDSPWVPLVGDDPHLALLTAIVGQTVRDARQTNDPRLRAEAADFLLRFAPAAHRLFMIDGGARRQTKH